MYDVDLKKDDEIQEFIKHPGMTTVVAMSKAFTHGKAKVRSTIPDPNHHLNTLIKDKYSYLKTPRWNGNAMEVGTAGQCVLVGYAKGIEEYRAVDKSAYRPECTGYPCSQHWEERQPEVLNAH